MSKITNTAAESNRDPAGHLGMLMVLGGDGAIERQEKDGQREVCASEMLPVKSSTYGCNADDVLRGWGIELGEPTAADPLFRPCKLPADWKIVPTDHDMWSRLVDDKGRVRAGIFYKAAFYDRKAHIALRTRFTISAYEWKREDVNRWAAVKDGENIIFVSALMPFDAEPATDQYLALDLAEAECKAWLEANYPGWEDPRNHWEK